MNNNSKECKWNNRNSLINIGKINPWFLIINNNNNNINKYLNSNPIVISLMEV